MTEWKDKRKNIYTIVITRICDGDVVEVRTHSNKKRAQERYEYLKNSWGKTYPEMDNKPVFKVTLTTSKLERASRGLK